MELVSRYKKTDIGVLPEDWNVKELKQLSEKIMVGIASSATHAYRETGVVMFRNQNIKPNHLNDSDILYIHQNYENAFKNKRLKAGDLLTARTGYPGTTCKVPEKYEGAQSFTTLITRLKNGVVDTDYLCSYLNSEWGMVFFEKNQIGGGQKNVNAGTLQKMQIPLPPTKAEQTAIATALSDTDNYITHLEKLIAKKRLIKQGAMQQLLKPKEGWVVKKFKDVTELITCGIASTPLYVDENIGVPFLSSTNVKNGQIQWGNYKCITKELHKQLFRNNPPLKGDILYSRVGTIGEAAIIDVDFEFSVYVSLTLIKTGKLLNNEFLMQLLNSQTYKKLANSTVLMGGGVGNLNVNVVREFPIPIPQIEEQISIAKKLCDMDKEIEYLEIKLSKSKRIKKGMMQQLLTGKIRLI